MRTVQPCYIEVEHTGMSSMSGIMDWKVQAVLWLSHPGYYKSTLSIMPPFTPNDHMLEVHGDKGDEDWQIFAWCVRDAIAKQGKFKKEERCQPKLLTQYSDFMNGRQDKIMVDGQRYYGGITKKIMDQR